MSLRFRLSLIFVCFAVLLVAALGSFAIVGASRELRAAAERQLSQAAEQMSERLELHMFERLTDVTTATALSHLFSKHGTDDQRDFLERLQQDIPNYAWIGFTDPKGRVLVSTGGLLEGEDVSARPWFTAGSKGPAALDVHEAKLLQRYLAPDKKEMLRFVDVTAPVISGDGHLIGVLGAHLSWSWADQVRRDVLSTIDELVGSDLLIVSRDGMILLGPPAEQGSTFQAKTEAYVTAQAQTNGMGVFKGLGWTVVARQPTSVAFAPIQTLTLTILVGGLLLASLAAAVGYWLAGTIARPLRQLADKAEMVRQGAHVSSLPNSSRLLEVASLSRSLTDALGALRRKEEELRAVNTLLEERVLLRTAQLEEARRRAEAATQAKSDFLATMSHEVRSPLNSIVGFTDLLLDDPSLPQDAARRVRTIQTAGQALTTVINDVLDWSKIEAGKVELVEDVFALRCLLSTTLDLVKVQAEAKSLTVRLEVDDRVPQFVRGDMARLRQIVLNLLGNAVKFTPYGTVALSVRLVDRPNRILIEVRDTGIGMSPDQIGNLFQRFSQADSSIERRFGGTGLGLAISQALAELMGGAITVESEIGRGSVFRLEIALAAATPDEIETMQDKELHGLEGLSATGNPFASSAHILVVDDMAANREIATALLERSGYAVTEAADGHRALELAGRETFDLILMDIQMPGLDGIVTAAEIRSRLAQAGREAPPILALTANVAPERLAEFGRAGMVDALAKPIQRAALLAKVSEWVERSPGERKVAESEAAISQVDEEAQVDREIFDEVVDLMGAPRVLASFGELSELIEDLMKASQDQNDLAHFAHKIVSLGGVLGFTGLALACQRLEQACSGRGLMEDALEDATSASTACLRQVSELARELGDGDVALVGSLSARTRK